MSPALLLLKGVWIKYRIFWILGIIASLMSIVSYYTAQYKEGQFARKEQRLHERFLEETVKRHEVYESKIQELNSIALKKQEELANINSDLEKRYHETKHQADIVSRKYDRLVRNGFRLRDPKASNRSVQVCRTSEDSNPRTSNSGNRSSSGTELSEETTRDLLSLARDADRVVEQLRIAQEYAKRLREQCNGQ